MRILLVEDDRAIGEAVRDHIAALGHAVDWARRISEADESVAVAHYALILLDLHLPDGNGLDFLRRLRKRSDATPVIVLTARDQYSDRIAGLNSGADDYLVKPFDLGELAARIAAVARRYNGNPDPVLTVAGLEIDHAARRVHLEGQEIVLTAREWAVLDALLARPGAIVSKDSIEDALYAFGSEVESNTVEVYLSRLRKKIGRERIVTLRGLGYQLADTPKRRSK
ncbi:MAG: response regulator transcription factor [Mesorhizobium sp.]|nr:response regulator transcription factor [Mesorhizobium sp.]